MACAEAELQGCGISFKKVSYIRGAAERVADGIRYKIDKVLDVRPAASLKAGGAGMRYKIRVRDRETYLFLEDSKTGAKWFMERKTS